MEIPAVLYGLWRNVKPRVKRSVDKIVKGASWHEAFQRYGMLSTDDTPGLLVNFVLARLGVPGEVLRAPLLPGGLEELARPFLITH